MTRPLRIEYAGAIYHVLSRGDRREAIVNGDSDRSLFLDLLGLVEIEAAAENPRPPRDETEQGKALQMIRDEMKWLGWTAMDLHRRRKGDPRKIAIARRLRKETAVTTKWIAEALSMGSSDYVRNRLYHCPE